MKGYVLRNLNEAKPQKRVCGKLWVLSDTEDFEGGNLSYLEATEPAEPHYHKEINEIYFVTSGRGKIELDGTEEKLKKGTLVLIEPGTVHRIIPKKDSILKVVVFSIPSWREEDEFPVKEVKSGGKP